MRFAMRALSGLIVLLVTFGLLGLAGWRLHSAISQSDGRRDRPTEERTYTVYTDTLTARSAVPEITAYGTIQAWRTLEIRAPAAGPVTEISDNFRDGMSVAQGELLLRVDPEIAERRVVDSKAAQTQAETDLAEARLSLAHVESELTAAKAQLAIRKGDLVRKETLHTKKLVTAPILDEATLAASAAEQAVTAKEQALVAVKARIEKAEAAVARAKITLSDTERALADTSYRAPYAGRLTDVTLTLGRRVSENEKLALLIDPSALEVSFPVRNMEFGHMLEAGKPGKLARLGVEVRLELADKTVRVQGVLERPAAVVSVNQAGRTVFARLTGDNAGVLRPGDFVTVVVSEPELHDVAVIPAMAATNDGRILVIGDGDRLKEVRTTILRRQGDNLIVKDVPFGSRYVRLRLPFLAPGIKVVPRQDSEPALQPETPPVAANPAGGAEADDVIVLSPQRRAALVRHVKDNQRMPAARREEILKALAAPATPRRVVDRLERLIARNGGQS